jgi:lauroyl/myristoyl acyltransferase
MGATVAPGVSAVALRPARAHRLNRAPLFRLAAVVATALPRGARLRVAAALGRAFVRACPTEAAAARANLQRVDPARPEPARARQVRDLFADFAVCFTDLLTANRRWAAAGLLAGRDGDAHVAAVLARGTGFVLLTAHLGNWELAGRTLVERGSGRPVHIVMAPEVDAGVERMMRGERDAMRFVTLRAPADAVPLVAALRRGEIVGMQGDRALGHRGDVGVEFFGATARFPLGPFLLARAAGVPVLPAYCVLGADRRYTVIVKAPITVERGAEEASLGAWAAGLADVIRRHPTQRFNFFDPWAADAR